VPLLETAALFVDLGRAIWMNSYTVARSWSREAGKAGQHHARQRRADPCAKLVLINEDARR